MGMESFYINLSLNNNCSYDLSGLPILFSDVIGDQRDITISYSLFSFFDGVSQIYSFVEKHKSNIIKIESAKEDIKQSTDNFLCFFERMYGLWADKIDHFRVEYGYLLINSNGEFFKFYKKMKKHIKKR